MDNRIIIYKGDSTELEVSVTDSEGAAFDLSNYEVTMSVKKSKYDTDYIFQVGDAVIDKTESSLGLLKIPISKNNTNVTPGTYYYDVEIKYLGNVYTVIFDSMEVRMDITE